MIIQADLKENIPIIIGAGPAGIAAALRLSQLGIKHILIDKVQLPRDKICGDALSGKVLNALKRNFPVIYDQLQSSTEALPTHGISFIAPNGARTDIPFRRSEDPRTDPTGFISKRRDFDYLLFKHLDPDFTQFIKAEVADVKIEEDKVIVLGKKNTPIAEGSIIISSEGARSLVAKKYTNYTKDPNHYCAGLRQYYSGVADLHAENYIELHFIDALQPGYFWIFPLPNGEANVGLGMLTSVVSKKKLNLTQIFNQIIQKHPEIAQRFKHAKPLETVKGWSLPLGSKKQQLCNNRLLLTGDAASLIDPFTGEGIANAIISGIKAAEWSQRATKEDNYSHHFLKGYEKELYGKIWNELKMSNGLQKVSHIKPLFNWIVNRANTHIFFKETLIDMFNQTDLRKKLFNPIFYFRLLFK